MRIRIRPFTLMRIRIQLHIKNYENLQHLAYRQTIKAPVCAATAPEITNILSSRLSHWCGSGSRFSPLRRIWTRILLPKMMRIHAPDPQHWLWVNCYRRYCNSRYISSIYKKNMKNLGSSFKLSGPLREHLRQWKQSFYIVLGYNFYEFFIFLGCHFYEFYIFLGCHFMNFIFSLAVILGILYFPWLSF